MELTGSTGSQEWLTAPNCIHTCRHSDKRCSSISKNLPHFYNVPSNAHTPLFASPFGLPPPSSRLPRSSSCSSTSTLRSHLPPRSYHLPLRTLTLIPAPPSSIFMTPSPPSSPSHKPRSGSRSSDTYVIFSTVDIVPIFSPFSARTFEFYFQLCF